MLETERGVVVGQVLVKVWVTYSECLLWVWNFLSDWWLEWGVPWERNLQDEVMGRTWWEGTGLGEEEQLMI